MDDTSVGDLVISGGGRLIVASDELLAQAAGLDQLSAEIRAATDIVHRASFRFTDGLLVDAPYSVRTADLRTTQALAMLRRCHQDSESVATLLRTAMTLYGMAETANEQVSRTLAARLGYTAGLLAPLLLLQVLPALGAGTVAVLLTGMAHGLTPREAWERMQEWVRQQNGVLTDPLTVILVRAAMGSSDDALGGALRLPPHIVTLLGDEGIGLTGLGSTAAVVALLGRHAGLLRETGVTVTRTSTTTATVPHSLAERAARRPAGSGGTVGPSVRVERHTRRDSTGEPETAPTHDQIRIDRYSSPGLPDRFEVYIAGTVDFSAQAGIEPWDMTSNVSGIAGLPAGSAAAVRDAMAQVGITPTSPVVLTGHSQGGLMAAAIAASGDYNITNVVTFGAPAGLIEIPASIPVLNVRHSDDIVPALGGYDVSSHALVVERELFAGRPVPAEPVFPAHQMSNYRETAALIDGARSAELRSALADLDFFVRGDGITPTVESSTFHATRVPEEEQ